MSQFLQEKKTYSMETDASKKKLYFSSQKYIILFQGIWAKRNYEITGNFTRKSGDKMATSHGGLIISYFVCKGFVQEFYAYSLKIEKDVTLNLFLLTK